MANEGARLLRLQAAAIQRLGQPLSVTRRAATQGGASTAQTVWFAPEAMTLKAARDLGVEGVLNLSEETATDFVCDGSQDVREALDVITYAGLKWRVITVLPQVVGGVAVALHCVAVRQGV